MKKLITFAAFFTVVAAYLLMTLPVAFAQSVQSGIQKAVIDQGDGVKVSAGIGIVVAAVIAIILLGIIGGCLVQSSCNMGGGGHTTGGIQGCINGCGGNEACEEACIP